MNIHDACEEAFKRGYERGRAEAIKELSERLKDSVWCDFVTLARKIDKIAEEMGCSNG